jgi:2-C-methyl-D-erythritol 2,4-cyclodiphosphate synthase
LERAAKHGAAIAAVPATDTVKEVGRETAVLATLDRSRIWLVQTPQAFRRQLLIAAHEAAAESGFEGTDDSCLVERLGHEVQVVPGDVENIKITWPADVTRSEQVMAPRQEGMLQQFRTRVGIGYDAHRFAEERPLVLAGVKFRESRGLLGHSDADVVCHAICDALLGAIGAGDIGHHFPDSDPGYKGISSISLLERVSNMVRESGWEIANVDTVVVAEEPRIASRIDEMRGALADAMGTDVDRVSVKGKTAEGMGFTGRGEGIATQAVATLCSNRCHSRAGTDSKE